MPIYSFFCLKCDNEFKLNLPPKRKNSIFCKECGGPTKITAEEQAPYNDFRSKKDNYKKNYSKKPMG
jgi:putative FmdB family regulatory protein